MLSDIGISAGLEMSWVVSDVWDSSLGPNDVQD